MTDQVAELGHGNPLLSPDLFVGRHSQLDRLCELARQGHSVLLIGGRRAGKSTLARQLSPANTGRHVLRADASGWDLSAEASALGGLRSAIEDRPATEYAGASRDEIVGALKLQRPMVLVIDEADRILQTAWCGGFFSFLRYLDDSLFRSEICIVLIGGPVLLLYRDPEDRGSPPLNTAYPMFMDPLDEGAVTELVGLAARGSLDPAVVMRLGGGHAFLTTRLLAEVWAGQSIKDAAESLFDQAQGTFEAWERQLGTGGRELYRKLPADGVAMSAFLGVAWGRYRGAQRVARSVGVLRVTGDRLTVGTALFRRWMSYRDPGGPAWDLAVSYATEDEELARRVIAGLAGQLNVFFGPRESASLWDPDTVNTLPNTFEVQCHDFLVLCTPAYQRKHWNADESEDELRERGSRVVFLDCGAVPDCLHSPPVISDWEKLSPPDLACAIRAAMARE